MLPERAPQLGLAYTAATTDQSFVPVQMRKLIPSLVVGDHQCQPMVIRLAINLHARGGVDFTLDVTVLSVAIFTCRRKGRGGRGPATRNVPEAARDGPSIPPALRNPSRSWMLPSSVHGRLAWQPREMRQGVRASNNTTPA